MKGNVLYLHRLQDSKDRDRILAIRRIACEIEDEEIKALFLTCVRDALLEMVVFRKSSRTGPRKQ